MVSIYNALTLNFLNFFILKQCSNIFKAILRLFRSISDPRDIWNALQHAAVKTKRSSPHQMTNNRRPIHKGLNKQVYALDAPYQHQLLSIWNAKFSLRIFRGSKIFGLLATYHWFSTSIPRIFVNNNFDDMTNGRSWYFFT